MAGEATTPVTTPPAAPAVAAAPPAASSDSPPAAPSAAAIPEAAPIVEAAAPAPEPAKAAEPAPTLLQQFDKDAAAKPAEGEKPADAKPAEGEKPVESAKPGDKPAEKPAEAKPAEAKPGDKPAEAAKPAEPAKLEPVAYEYALPETIKMDDGLKTEFHTALDAFRADPAKGAQPLIDLHNKTMESYAASVEQNQRSVWNDTRKGWQTNVLADEQIGGSGHQTAMGAIARMRDMFVPEKDRAAFESFLSVTGAGDHPAFLKMLHNAARFYDEPAMPPPNVKPSPTNGQQPGKRAVMYDHPRSHGNRQQ